MLLAPLALAPRALAPLLLGTALAAPRDPALPHLSGPLRALAAGDPKGTQAAFAQAHPDLLDPSGVVVVVEVDDGPRARAALAERGLFPGRAVAADGGAWLQLRVPLPRLADLEGVPGLRLARLPHLATPKGGRDRGTVVSEGLDAIFQDGDWYEARWRGRGIRIGIADVGFAGVEQLTNDELPARVHMSAPEQGADLDHGVAVAEVVHDMAPRSRLHLFPFQTDVEFLEVVADLPDEGVDVVNGSIGFDNVWHADGTSPWTRAVDRLAGQGVLWVAAAGNEGQRYLGGPLTDVDGDGVVEIDGVEEAWVPVVDHSAAVSLRWSEPMRAAAVDLDLEVRTEGGVPCGRSEEPQDGAPSSPWEGVLAGCAGDWARVRVLAPDGADPEGLTGWLYAPYGIDPWGTTAELGTLTLPGDTRRGLSVGVCDRAAGSAPVYASRGPTDDGRIKPDLCAPDGVSTVTYGPGGFLGTSAATAHGTGMAALVMDAEHLDGEPAEVVSWLEDMAEDLGDTGQDPRFGAGALNAGPPPEGCHCASGGGRGGGGLGLLLLPLLLVRRREG